ncbi:MAG: UDP-N-acetylmuramate dehydrogenase [Microgenomates group bacterium]
MGKKYLKIIKFLGKKRVKEKEPLSLHTTFKIGGPADLFYEAKTEEEIIKAVLIAKKLKIPYFILGGGSNLLVADEGFRGLVIKIANSQLEIKDRKIIAGAGTKLSTILKKAKDHSLAGLEFLIGIPGTVGGAVRGNAGAWGMGIGDKVKKVKVLTKKGEIKWLEKKECEFSYRQSRFKKSEEIILAVEFQLEKGEAKKIEEMMKEYLSRRQGQPKEPSAGCIFINPKPLAAGELIDKAGFKGKSVGDAQVSPKHANFIVNIGKAKAKDVLKLIGLIKEKIKEKFGVELKEEICFLGFAKFKKEG